MLSLHTVQLLHIIHKDNLNMNKNNVYKTKVRKSKELLEFTLELKLSQFEFT